MTLAYKGTETKASTLSRLKAHRQADELVQGLQGQYWGDGKGCAVGCLTQDPSGGHNLFPTPPVYSWTGTTCEGVRP